MRKLMFVLCLLLSLSLFADYIPFEGGDSEVFFRVIESNSSYTEFEFTLPGIEVYQETINNVTYDRFHNEFVGYTQEAGYPELPVFSAMLAIPNTGSCNLEVLRQSQMIHNGLNIYPSQGWDIYNEVDDFIINTNYYTTGNESGYKKQPFTVISDPAVMRDFRVVNVSINPFTYDPVTKQLTVQSRVSLRINHTPQAGINEIHSNRQRSESFEHLYQGMILNYDEFCRIDDPDYQQRSMIVVYADDDNLEAELDPYIEWKKNKGFFVRKVRANDDGAGTSSSSIKAYIQDLYDNAENPPEYIVIIGDGSGQLSIPVFTHGDHNYTKLDGNDILPEAFVGRISIESVTQFSLFLAKMNLYERDTSLNANTYDKSLMVGDTSPSGLSCILTCKHAMELIRKFDWDHQYDELYSGNPSPTSMENSMNAGTLFWIYRGYLGMSGWGAGNAAALTNTNKLTNAVINTCSSGTFATGTSNTESIFRAGTPAAPKGSISSIGMATSGTHTQLNNCLTNGTMHGLYADNMSNMGEAIMRGKLTLYNTFWNVSGAQSYVGTFTEWNNLIGDPTLDVFRRPPSDMVVAADAQIPVGQEYFSTYVEDENNNPVEGAWVTLRLGDDLFGSGYTDETGNVTLHFEGGASGDASLVVTKPDHNPVLSTVSLTGDGIVSIFDSSIDDANGNDDGFINPGEEVEMTLQIENFRSAPVMGPEATISTATPGVIITSDYSVYNDLYIGGHVGSHTPYVFTVSPDFEAPGTIEFDISVANATNDDVYTTKFWVEVKNPQVDVTNFTLANASNTTPAPGDMGTLTVDLTNMCPTAIPNVYGRLTTNTAAYSIMSDIAQFGDLTPNQAVTNLDPFSVVVGEELYPGQHVKLMLELFNNNGYQDVKEIDVVVGSNASYSLVTGPDEYGYICIESSDSHPQAPTYNWIEINPSAAGGLPGTSAGLIDTGNHDENNGVNNYIHSFQLPFPVKFYGVDYDSISISSKGFVTFGGQDSDSPFFRNYNIPDAGGPSPMIAAMWDDIYVGSGGVYYYYDNTENIYIVEWYNCPNNNGGNETMQIIIYDPMYYPTYTGDAMIKIQYSSFQNTDSSFSLSGDQGNYCTIGLQNHVGNVGLEITYGNTWAANCGTVSANTALLFTVSPQALENQKLLLTDTFISDHMGNLNAILDSDEQVSMVFNIQNISEVAADSANITLTCDNADVAISSVQSGIMPLESHMAQQAEFSVTTNANVAANTVIEFTLEIAYNGTTESYKIPVEVGVDAMPSGAIVGTVTEGAVREYDGIYVKAGSYMGYPGAMGSYMFYVTPGDYLVKCNLNGAFADQEYNLTINTNDIMYNTDFVLNEYPAPSGLTTMGVADESVSTGGYVQLDWSFNEVTAAMFQHFNIYREVESNYVLVGTTTDTTYNDVVEANVNYNYHVTAQHLFMESAPTQDVEGHWELHGIGDGVNKYTTFMSKNYPNPFNPSTNVQFGLKETGKVQIKIYNIKGELVKTVVDEVIQAGNHQFTWHGVDNKGKAVGSGVYFIKMKSSEFSKVQKSVLLK